MVTSLTNEQVGVCRRKILCFCAMVEAYRVVWMGVILLFSPPCFKPLLMGRVARTGTRYICRLSQGDIQYHPDGPCVRI